MQVAEIERSITDLKTRDFIIEKDGIVPALDSLTPETQTQRDLREIGVLQSQFDRVLRRRYDKKDMLQRSYNPVIDRWRIERLRKAKNRQGERAYIKEVHANLRTNLKERMQVADNIVRYNIGVDDLYSEHFPTEPFRAVLERGAAYRLQHGSPEAEREGMQGERGGWEKIRSFMTNPETPVGTKITSFSPKGRVAESAYDRNVVDEYELMEDLSGRYMKLTRTVVDFDEADYISATLSLDPHYFDGYDGRPLDAWMLSHPVGGSLSGLQERMKGVSSETFEKMYESGMLTKLEERYAEEISKEKVDWKRVALIFNAYYNQADEEQKRVLSGETEHNMFLSQKAIEDTISRLGWKKPEEKGGTGCPTSKGFSMSNLSLWGTYGNSTAWFGGGGGGGSSASDKLGSLEFTCPRGHWNSRPRGKLIPQCLICGVSVKC